MLCVEVAGVAIRFLLPGAWGCAAGPLAGERTRAECNLGRGTLRGSNEGMNSAKCDSRSNGYAEVKARPFSHRAFHPQASTMRFHDVASDGETETGASGLAGTRGIHAVEAFKNSFLLRLRDADAGVGNGDDDTAI